MLGPRASGGYKVWYEPAVGGYLIIISQVTPGDCGGPPIMARRHDDLDFLRALAARALREGGRSISPVAVEWDISGNCSDPYTTNRVARRAEGNGPGVQYLDIITRCRKCENCRTAKQRLWTARARAEITMAPRTWFGTLTLSPEAQYYFLAIARQVADEAIGKYEDATPEQQFMRRCWAISPDITKWLKRVRKESGSELRFLLVAEAHKSGEPHYHCLIHETDFAQPVRKRTLQTQWKLGFSQWKLVTDLGGARYVTKYINKGSLARVRASIRYGQQRACPLELEKLVNERPSPLLAPSMERARLAL